MHSVIFKTYICSAIKYTIELFFSSAPYVVYSLRHYLFCTILWYLRLWETGIVEHYFAFNIMLCCYFPYNWELSWHAYFFFFLSWCLDWWNKASVINIPSPWSIYFFFFKFPNLPLIYLCENYLENDHLELKLIW